MLTNVGDDNELSVIILFSQRFKDVMLTKSRRSDYSL